MRAHKIDNLSNFFYSLATKNRKSAAGIAFLCKEDNSIFLCKRSLDSSFPNTWSIPGGKIQDNESPIDAAIREVIEELSGTPDPSECEVIDADIFDIPSFNYTTFIISISKKEKDNWKPKLNREHTNCQWFDIDKPPKELHPGAKKTINKIVNNLEILQNKNT